MSSFSQGSYRNVSVSDASVAKAAKKGLDLEKLGSDAVVGLDANGDGTVDDAEIDGAVAYADVNGDGFVRDAETKRLQALFSSYRTREDWAHLQGGKSHASTLTGALKGRRQTASNAFEQARVRAFEARAALEAAREKAAPLLGGSSAPTTKLADLQRERAAMGDLPAVARELEQNRAQLARARTELPQLERQYKADRALVSQYQQGLNEQTISALEGQIAEKGKWAAKVPSDYAKNEHIKLYESRVRELEKSMKTASSRDRPVVAEALAKARTDLSELRRFNPEQDKKWLTGAKQTLTECLGKRAAYERALANDGSAVRQKSAEVTSLEARVTDGTQKLTRGPELDRQIAYARHVEPLAQKADATARDEAAARATYDREVQATAPALRLAEGDDQVQAHGGRTARQEALEAAAGAKQALAELRDPSMQPVYRTLAEAEAVKAKLDKGELKHSWVNKTALNNTLEHGHRIVGRKEAAHEVACLRVITKLEDPSFMAQLRELPAAERDRTLSTMVGSIAHSKYGREYFEKNIAPAMAGAPTAAAPWSEVFSGRGGNRELAMSIVRDTSHLIAAKGGSTLLDSAMCRGLGVDKSKLPALEEATRAVNDKNLGRAQQVLQKAGLGFLAGQEKLVGDSFTAGAMGVALYDTVRDANFKSFYDASKSYLAETEVTQDGLRNGLKHTSTGVAVANWGPWVANTAGYLKDSSSLLRFGKMVGNAGAPLGAAIGALGLYGKDGSIQRGDVGGTVGNTMTMYGGAVGSVGLAMCATGIGAPLGALVGTVGGVIAFVGGAIEFFFGDSEGEKWLKAHAQGQYYSF